ncbi:uncharacterized protein LOC8258775 [Ricinus communis]|uniref:Uncharacterized protein n=1 Tax=Ricinus communis TaxID=3988 RepID=B9RZL6_RICCO|nr:uncharacterized protein LOC8258775 [Ricinus communis]EEF43049.1 conserved hypothetical protein [Ricinus communis]|eukprot:XP_002519185.1 uncharacterized protein LOC8258775 [Ricinus communis]
MEEFRENNNVKEVEKSRDAHWRYCSEGYKYETVNRPSGDVNGRRSIHRYSKSTGSTWNYNKTNNQKNHTTRASSWSFTSDPELKRQRRVVKYKAYAVEGNMKTSLRNSFRWIKNKYCALVHGY